MKVHVDPNLCIGCGMCAGMVPDIFQLGDNGLAEAVAQPGPSQEAEANEAAEGCPVSAIRTEE